MRNQRQCCWRMLPSGAECRPRLPARTGRRGQQVPVVPHGIAGAAVPESPRNWPRTLLHPPHQQRPGLADHQHQWAPQPTAVTLKASPRRTSRSGTTRLASPAMRLPSIRRLGAGSPRTSRSLSVMRSVRWRVSGRTQQQPAPRSRTVPACIGRMPYLCRSWCLRRCGGRRGCRFCAGPRA
jgi:hypothetical protein